MWLREKIERQTIPVLAEEFCMLIWIFLMRIAFGVPAGSWSAFCFLASWEKSSRKVSACWQIPKTVLWAAQKILALENWHFNSCTRGCAFKGDSTRLSRFWMPLSIPWGACVPAKCAWNSGLGNPGATSLTQAPRANQEVPKMISQFVRSFPRGTPESH